MALTVPQIREHVGAMFQFGLNNAAFLAKGGMSFDDFVLWAKDYRINGTLGTVADRTEAMKTFLRYSYEKVTGRLVSDNLHYYKNHYIDLISPGESAVLEP